MDPAPAAVHCSAVKPPKCLAFTLLDPNHHAAPADLSLPAGSPGFHSRSAPSSGQLAASIRSHQQAVAVISRLGGSAGDMCRGMSMQELTVGGPHPNTGAPLAPIAYILAGLQHSYAPFQEEQSMAFMMAYTGFRRAQGEPMDDMLSRFDMVARRANEEAGYTMSTAATASFLVKIIGISPKLLVDLLRPLLCYNLGSHNRKAGPLEKSELKERFMFSKGKK